MHFTLQESYIADNADNKIISIFNDKGIFKLDTLGNRAYYAATTQTLLTCGIGD